jgi:bacillolysin
MHRTWPVLATALTLALTVPQAALAPSATARTAPTVAPAAASAASAAPAEQDPRAETALRRLKAAAESPVRVHRDPEGRIDFVSSSDGEGLLAGSTRPASSFAQQLARYGEAFGIDGTTSRAVVDQTIPSTTGGAVVRSQQTVDGVPVFGGEVVMSLDSDQDVVSIDAATSDATEVPAPVVSEARARRTALAVTAKAHRVPVKGLTATSRGRHLYDPALVHVTDPGGARPVWQFEVRNGFDVRETVLVGTGRGEVALHVDSAPKINRLVCDNDDVASYSDSTPVPRCTTGVDRREGGAPSPVADVNAAYDNLGVTSKAYADLDGIDLTEAIGTPVTNQKRLMATVRWCYAEVQCPFPNAFWDGTQMVFGTGYAGADDVVAHELTHGYVQHTSDLFYLNQSGALNESLADTIGEIVDHRNPASTENDDDWVVGEDLPGAGTSRSMEDPTLNDFPDRMTSPDFVTSDLLDQSDGVHENGGVGNKTAYLISQGGSFNGHTVTGIDDGDPGLTKTGQLYLEVIKRLTSGAQYADLGRVLATTCDQLVQGASPDPVPDHDFEASDCDAVRAASAATELALPPADPAAAHAEAPRTCAPGARLVQLMRDDDADGGSDDFAFPGAELWERTPADNTPDDETDAPKYARSGLSSWFAFDPDPEIDDVSSSSMASRSFVVPRSQPTYLHFAHAYVFEYYPATADGPGTYLDGGQVEVQTLSAGRWTTRPVTYVNGPTRTLEDNGAKVFGGDSHGYGSTRVDLSTLGGQTARVVFRVSGDEDTSYIGWWVDDIRLFTCPDDVASVPRTTVAAGTTSAKVSWQPPAYVGASPVKAYRVTRSTGQVATYPGTTRSATLRGLDPTKALTVSVAAVTEAGQLGAPARVRIDPTHTIVSSSGKVARNAVFPVTTKVALRGAGTPAAGMPVLLQRRGAGSSVWSTVSSRTTNSLGQARWSVRQSRTTAYRVLSRGAETRFGSTSASRVVGLR